MIFILIFNISIQKYFNNNIEINIIKFIINLVFIVIINSNASALFINFNFSFICKNINLSKQRLFRF